jgi:REP element-mobilizing transposase RayT
MIPLEPGNIYHVFNRANGSEKLFISERNYDYFINKSNEYLQPIANIFCYCLMPNHFHFLLRVKELSQLKETFSKFKTLEKFLPEHERILSKQFANLFSCYTQSFIKEYGRKGSLFMKNFKRKLVTDEKYLRKLVHYIHWNPVESRLCLSLENWKYLSYPGIITGANTRHQEVLSWSGDIENFIYCHKRPPELSGIE